MQLIKISEISYVPISRDLKLRLKLSKKWTFSLFHFKYIQFLTSFGFITIIRMHRNKGNSSTKTFRKVISQNITIVIFCEITLRKVFVEEFPLFLCILIMVIKPKLVKNWIYLKWKRENVHFLDSFKRSFKSREIGTYDISEILISCIRRPKENWKTNFWILQRMYGNTGNLPVKI